MNNILLIAINIFIAAAIGYVTNYLAVRMLFHPRREWRIAGRRVPFTPGLIPKRRSDIAAALGRVVSEYLVTADGLKSMLLQPELRGQLERRLQAFVIEWSDKEETLEQLAIRLLGDQAVQNMQASIADLAENWLTSSLPRALREAPAMHQPLEESLRNLNVPLDKLVEQDGPRWILKMLQEELSSPQGVLLIRRVVSQLVDGIGGMMGMLAGMFMDEEKMTLKVRQVILQYLHSNAAHEAIGALLSKQVSKLAAQSPAQLLSQLREAIEQNGWQVEVAVQDREQVASDEPQETVEREEDAVKLIAEDAERAASPFEGQAAHQMERLSDEEWLVVTIMSQIPWRSWLLRIWDLTPRMLLSTHKDWLLDKVPNVSDRLLAGVADNIEHVVRAVNLPKLVQEQVEHFPIEQVEQVILSITGREFRAITWLGAVLGGLIGTVQALLYIGLG